MRRSIRYALALLVSGAATGLASILTDSALLLVGIAQVYGVAAAVALRPEVRRAAGASGGSNAAFSGATTFGVLTMAQGLSVEFHFGAAILAFGLANLGLVCGIRIGAATDATEADAAETDAAETDAAETDPAAAPTGR